MRVALVEDEPLIVTMVALNLRRAGYEVATFRTAEELLANMAGERFDLILLDIGLPGMTGEEALPLVRRLDRQAAIIMLTARSETETKVATLLAGADDYLAKPFDVAELMARIAAQLRRRAG